LDACKGEGEGGVRCVAAAVGKVEWLGRMGDEFVDSVAEFGGEAEEVAEYGLGDAELG